MLSPAAQPGWRRRQPHPDKSDEQDALAIAKTLLQDLVELPLGSRVDLHWTLSLVLRHWEGALAFWERYPSPGALAGVGVTDRRTSWRSLRG